MNSSVARRAKQLLKAQAAELAHRSTKPHGNYGLMGSFTQHQQKRRQRLQRAYSFGSAQHSEASIASRRCLF
jgi:hypothetical protein